MDTLPTPEELGDRLKRGDITKGEAIEIMSERARREALQGLYGPAPDAGGNAAAGGPRSDNSLGRTGWWIFVAILIGLGLIAVVLQFLE